MPADYQLRFALPEGELCVWRQFTISPDRTIYMRDVFLLDGELITPKRTVELCDAALERRKVDG